MELSLYLWRTLLPVNRLYSCLLLKCLLHFAFLDEIASNIFPDQNSRHIQHCSNISKAFK
jgi:hypothetical protein